MKGAQLELDSGKVLWDKRKKEQEKHQLHISSPGQQIGQRFSRFTLRYSKTSLVWNNWEKEKCQALQTKIRSYVIFLAHSRCITL